MGTYSKTTTAQSEKGKEGKEGALEGRDRESERKKDKGRKEGVCGILLHACAYLLRAAAGAVRLMNLHISAAQ